MCGNQASFTWFNAEQSQKMIASFTWASQSSHHPHCLFRLGALPFTVQARGGKESLRECSWSHVFSAQSGAGGRNPNKVLPIAAVVQRWDFLRSSSATLKEGLFGAGGMGANQTKSLLMPLKFPETAGWLFFSQLSHLLLPEQRGKVTSSALCKIGRVCWKVMWRCGFCSACFFQEWKVFLLSYALIFLIREVFGKHFAPSCLPIFYKESSNQKRLWMSMQDICDSLVKFYMHPVIVFLLLL